MLLQSCYPVLLTDDLRAPRDFARPTASPATMMSGWNGYRMVFSDSDSGLYASTRTRMDRSARDETASAQPEVGEAEDDPVDQVAGQAPGGHRPHRRHP